MTFDNTLPHALPWNYPWIKDEIERRDEYIAQLEAELAHQRPQNHDSGAIDGESVKVPAESETEAHSEPDSREKLLGDLERLTQTWHDYDGNFMRVYGGVAYAQVKELLDRQASITEREFMEIREDLTADNLWMHERIAELQSQLEAAQGVNKRQDLDYIEQKRHIAELREKNDALREWKVCYERMKGERDELRSRIAELESTLNADFRNDTERTKNASAYIMSLEDKVVDLKERITNLEHQRTVMARKLMQAERDRERYRAALGKAIDCADEIRRLS